MANSIEQEIGRRRTFAIISHPDAGKTTLTEKFLLYGGAINTAGSVKGKANMQYLTGWRLKKKEVSLSLLLYYSLNTKENVSISLIHQDMRISQKIRIVH